jgi:hypothetical protein
LGYCRFPGAPSPLRSIFVFILHFAIYLVIL